VPYKQYFSGCCSEKREITPEVCCAIGSSRRFSIALLRRSSQQSAACSSFPPPDENAGAKIDAISSMMQLSDAAKFWPNCQPIPHTPSVAQDPPSRPYLQEEMRRKTRIGKNNACSQKQGI
jgi:hypothetical protein